jgi:5'-nucleotidase
MLRIKTALFLALAATLLGRAAARAQGLSFTIVHINDTHSWLDSYGEKYPGHRPSLGGIARAATVIAAARTASANTLFLHAGDLMHGTEFFNGTFGVPELTLLGQLGLDAMAVGNHEFDFGPDFLSAALGQATPSFPLLSANCELSQYPALARWIQPALIKPLGAVDIGIFGMTTPDDPAYQPAPVKILGAQDPATIMNIAGAQVAALRAGGAEVVVLLSHLGADYDQAVAANVPGIDVIIGGHTHAPTPTPITIRRPDGGSTLYVRAGANYSAVGELRLRYDQGAVALEDFTRVILDERVTPDPRVAASVAELERALETRYGDLYDHTLAYVLQELHGSVDADSAARDSPLGNLLTDAYRARTGTQIAITPSGLFGGPLYRGQLVAADLMRVTSYGYDPATGYGFKLATFEITGAELIKGLEVGLAYGGDLFLEVSGVHFRYDSSAPIFARIDARSVRVNGRPLRPEQRYSVTVNEGSAKLLPLIGVTITNLEFLPDLEYQVFRDYVTRAPLLCSRSWGRIWDTWRAAASTNLDATSL